MYCGQCGTANHEEAGHCEACGAPLLITTGARACANCGASLGDQDRFCTSCGTAANSTSSSESYDAADDFGELDIDDIQLDELPDWLQGMAPTQSSERPTPRISTSPDQPSPADLPDWLRETDTAGSRSSSPSPHAEQDEMDHQPVGQFSLVSDEDLPDWLKALSDEVDEPASAPPTPTQPTAGASASPTRAVANLYDVPPISRAWQAQGRFVDPAQVSAARQEFLPLETISGTPAEQHSSRNIWDTGPIDLPDADQETRPFSVTQSLAGGDRGKLIARIVILALLIIVVLILGFFVLQGL